MKKCIRARAFVPAFSVLSLAVAASVQAQGIELNPIVVTSTRFESSPQANPIATQVITAEEIQESSAITVSEVLNKLGGVHTRSSFTGIPDASVDLRGFGMTGDQNTLVLVNGQRLSENEGISARLSSIPVHSIERIEILRGAGAVLYGNGATGGTINIITRPPVVDGDSGTASVLIGSHQLQDSRVGVQSKRGDLGITLNGQRYKTDNYRHGNQANLETLNGEIRYGGRDDFFALNFAADDQKSNLPGVRKVNLVTGVNQFISDPRGITTPRDYLDSKTDAVSVRGEKRFDAVRLALDVGKRNKTRNSFGSYEDSSGTSLAKTRTEVTTISPRLLWEVELAGMKNSMTVGADWHDWSYDSGTVGTGIAPSLIEKGTQNNQATYFRNELFVAEKTRLTLGFRNERVTQRNSYDGHDAWVSSNAIRSNERHLSAQEMALQQSLDAGYSVYGRLGRSFRVANIDENRCDLYAVSCGSLLNPQTSRDREIGVQWRGRESSVRASFYTMDIENEIHYNPFTLTNMNLSPTERRGLEIAGKFTLSRTLDFGVRYARAKARFKEGTYTGYETNDYSYAPFSANLTGKNVPLVPKERLSLNLGWQLQAGTQLVVFANYVGAQNYDNDQANSFQKMPSYKTADIKVTHAIGSWKLSVGVNNVLDKSYYSYGVTNVSGSTPVRYNVYPEDRRNAYVSVDYRF